MAFWVGLTGGIGSGKSQAAAAFAVRGVPLIDADGISRSLTAAGGAALPEIRRVFGSGVFDGDTLDRAALRDAVFSRPAVRQQLEDIMFPLIFQKIRTEQARHAAAVYGIIEIPLLAENPVFQTLCDRILTVESDMETRIARVMSRSGLTRGEVERIMAAQAADADRRTLADDILYNRGSLVQLDAEAGRLHAEYTACFSLPKREPI
ncbi:MAG: dephospho-CoA kinase [Neisseria sp.]|nr:dephospho-CoA kinase [Neisseria sp.]